MIDFDSLYREFAPRIHRFVLGLSGDVAVAEDVTAETFVRVWATRDRVRHETVRAFLFTIARNLWLQGIRSRWRQREFTADDADRAPGPDVQAAGRIDLARVVNALATLDPADRAAVLMRAQEEMSYEEIAQSLGISVPAMLKSEPVSLPERERRAALERTRSLLKLRTAFFALALGCNLMTFSFAFSGDGVTWFMWRDAPGMAGVLLASSMGFWLAYFRVLKQLQVSGM